MFVIVPEATLIEWQKGTVSQIILNGIQVCATVYSEDFHTPGVSGCIMARIAPFLTSLFIDGTVRKRLQLYCTAMPEATDILRNAQ